MALLVASITPEHNLAARRYLEESVSRDPQSADGWGQLARALMSDYFNHWNEARESPEAAKGLVRQAEKAVEEALKIDPSLAGGHFADGFVRRAKADHAGALDAFDRAVQLDPNFAFAYVQKANQLVMVGRSKEAPPLVLRALTLSPRDPSIAVYYWVIGRAYFVMENYKDAIVWLRKSVEMRPTLWFNGAYLLSAYALTGRHEQPEGRAALNEYKAGFGGYTVQHIRDLYETEFHRVTGGGRPPPVPTERSVQISRTTLFRR
jgi:adenylate cyclase